jgi:5-methylcytosine-specific restriction enzyme A
VKLRTLQPGLRTLSKQLRAVPTPSEQRMAGRKLQTRRLRMWTQSPFCAACGRLTDWPSGFELDHRVRLADGGKDTEDNCQVLCVYVDPTGAKAGCHAKKTAREGGG